MESGESIFPSVAFCTEGFFKAYGKEHAEGTPDVESHCVVARSLRTLKCGEVELVATTLAPDPMTLTEEVCRQYRTALSNLGTIVRGGHWMLAGTKGYLTNPEAGSLEQTVEIIVHLAHVIHWLGGDILIHGSPVQRNILWYMTYPEAFEAGVEVYSRVVPRIKDLGVKICIEQLTPLETNFLGTHPEVNRFIDSVNSRTGRDYEVLWDMIDTKALLGICGNNVQVAAEQIRRFGPRAAHCHLNDVNLYGPGCGDIDFNPLFQALYDVGFHKPWSPLGRTRTLSTEVFRYDNLLKTAEKSMNTVTSWRPAAA